MYVCECLCLIVFAHAVHVHNKLHVCEMVHVYVPQIVLVPTAIICNEYG